MPGNYAHYRFGAEMIGLLSPRLQRTVGRFRQLYDLGLHGPDLFYYTDSLCIATDGKPGKLFHEQSGREFFQHACRGAKLRASEGMTAYLCGLLAHYTLDSMCHPFIHKNTTHTLSHNQIEAEFDRYLLTLDGKKPAHLYDGSRHIAITAGEAELIAALYPGVTAAQVAKCARNMAKCTHALVLHKGPGRDIKLGILQRIAPETAHRVIGLHPNRACVGLNPSLMRLYEMAAGRYSLLMEQMVAHLKKNIPLGVDFDPVFGK